jgi:hypothetical protein
MMGDFVGKDMELVCDAAGKKKQQVKWERIRERVVGNPRVLPASLKPKTCKVKKKTKIK